MCPAGQIRVSTRTLLFLLEYYAIKTDRVSYNVLSNFTGLKLQPRTKFPSLYEGVLIFELLKIF